MSCHILLHRLRESRWQLDFSLYKHTVIAVIVDCDRESLEVAVSSEVDSEYYVLYFLKVTSLYITSVTETVRMYTIDFCYDNYEKVSFSKKNCNANFFPYSWRYVVDVVDHRVPNKRVTGCCQI